MLQITTERKRPSNGYGEPSSQRSSLAALPTAFGSSGDGLLTHLRQDVARSPWGAAAFAATLLMLLFLVVDRLGVLTPGPVLRNLVMHASLDDTGGSVLFRVEGDKATNDTLRARVASWIFSDGTAMAVALEGNPPAQNRLAGDHFVSQEYSARIPPAARTDAGARLRVCLAYDPGMSCVETPFSEIAG